MQSDERVAGALSALRPRIAAFRFAVSGALGRAKHTLECGSGPSQTRTALGEFGSRLIDADRFAMISSGAGPLDTAARTAIEGAVEVLETLLRGGDEQFAVEIRSETSLGAAVRERLATLGSAFGAAALSELVRRRIYDPAQHESSFDGYQFERWITSERRLAPPLVVRIDGADLDAFDLAPFIDGWVRLVLLVAGPCTAAPLSRLVSPGAFIAQSGDLKVLESVTEFDGPAVIAVMNGAEARFVHDPRAGSALWQRIQITQMPDVQPRKGLGTRSAWQQRDDVAHLKALAEQPALPVNGPEAVLAGMGAVSSDPADRLTAWLLDQSNPDGIP